MEFVRQPQVEVLLVTSKLKNKGGDNIEFVRQPQIEVLLVEC